MQETTSVRLLARLERLKLLHVLMWISLDHQLIHQKMEDLAAETSQLVRMDSAFPRITYVIWSTTVQIAQMSQTAMYHCHVSLMSFAATMAAVL